MSELGEQKRKFEDTFSVWGVLRDEFFPQTAERIVTDEFFMPKYGFAPRSFHITRGPESKGLTERAIADMVLAALREEFETLLDFPDDTVVIAADIDLESKKLELFLDKPEGVSRY